MKKQPSLPLIEVKEISWKQASKYMVKLATSNKDGKASRPKAMNEAKL